MTWSPEREAEARRLWTEGRSAADIAVQLGGVTDRSVSAKIRRMGLRRRSASAKPKPLCPVPGCGSKLSAKNASGVCLTHAHAPGFCRCPSCLGQLGARRAEPKHRPDVRVVEVPYPTSNSGVALKARVSLKREPWATA